MSWSIDTPVRTGSFTCVPIVDTCVSVDGVGHRIAAHGKKRPVLILVFQENKVAGVDLDGLRHDLDDIERRYPEAIAMAAARLARDAG